MRGRLALALAFAAAVAFGAAPTPGSIRVGDAGVAYAASGRPLVFAYYYIWYSPSSWKRAKTDLPTLGAYDSADPAVVAQHVAWAKEAGIDALIVSWKHEPRLDAPLAVLADTAKRAGLKLVLLYQGLDFNRRPLDDATVANDLNWFVDQYGSDPVFDVFGRPAVVWSGTWGYTDTQIARVRSSIGAPSRILLLGSERSGAAYGPRARLLDGDAYYWSSADPLETGGYRTRLQTLATAVRADGGLWIAPAAPGFDARLVGGSSIVPRRDGATLTAAWSGALSTSPDAIGIISWNEFSENSAIEPSTTYGTTYLDLTRRLTQSLGGAAPSRAPSPAAGGSGSPGADGSSGTSSPTPGRPGSLPPGSVVGAGPSSPGPGDALGIVVGVVLVGAIVAVGRSLRRRPSP